MDEIKAEKINCENCKYYLGRYALIPAGFYGIDGDCMNKNLFYPQEKTPCDTYGNCLFWESKDSPNDLDDIL